MGGRNPDYIGTIINPDASWTLAQLWGQRVLVEARCDACGVRLRVDLDGLLRSRGPAYSLWNRTPRCKVIGCPGRVTFWARDSTGAGPQKLVGERRIVPPDPPRWNQRRS
jgi:hypothetical protein